MTMLEKSLSQALSLVSDRVSVEAGTLLNNIAVLHRELGRWDSGEFRWVQENTGARVTYLVTRDGYIFAAKESEVDY